MEDGIQSTQVVVEAIPAHLLQTNEPPSASEAQQLRSILAEAKTRAASFGIEDPLQTEVQSTITNCETILSPIRHLPPELIGKTILHALERGFYDTRPLSTSLDTREGVWVYSQVCHLWRQEVLSHPSIWANLDITDDSNSLRKSSPDILKAALMRSLDQSLTLKVYLTDSDSTSVTLLSLLLAESCRWRSVSLSLGRELLLERLAPFQGRLHRLQSLELTCNDHTYDEQVVVLTPFSDCPALTHLSARNVGDLVNVQLPWSQITHLKQDNTDDLPVLLQKVPNLVCLETSTPNIPGFPVHHPTLCTIDLFPTDISIYPLLQLPALSELCVYEEELYSSMETRVRSPIRAVRLDFSPASIAPGLYNISSLTTLNLLETPASSFLTALTRDHAILPRLEHLYLEWELLADNDLTADTLILARSRFSTLKEILFYPFTLLGQNHLDRAEKNYRRFQALEKEKDGLVIGFRLDLYPFSQYCY